MDFQAHRLSPVVFLFVILLFGFVRQNKLEKSVVNVFVLVKQLINLANELAKEVIVIN